MRVRPIELRSDPACRPLKHGEFLHVRRDRRHDLYSARAGADNADPSVVQRDIMTPTGRVKHVSFEVLDAVDLRISRIDQAADGRNHDACGEGVALRGRERPHAITFVKLRADDLGVASKMGVELPLIDKADQITLNLIPTRIATGPVRILLERKRINVRLHVAGAPWIGVVAPSPTHFARALEHDERLDSFLFEPNGCADPSEPRPDDRNGEIRRAYGMHRESVRGPRDRSRGIRGPVTAPAPAQGQVANASGRAAPLPQGGS